MNGGGQIGAGDTGGSRRLAPAVAALVLVALVIAAPSGATDTDTDLLTVTITGGGTVTGSGVNCTSTTTENSASRDCVDTEELDGGPVTLSATPGPGFTGVAFAGHSGCTGGVCNFRITEDTHITVGFTESTPPAVPQITGPAASAVVRSDAGAALSFTVSSDTAAARCWIDDDPAHDACTSPWPLPASTADGAHTLHVRAADVNGNVSGDASEDISYVNVPDTALSGTPVEGGAVNSTATAFTLPSPALCTLDGADVTCSNLGDAHQVPGAGRQEAARVLVRVLTGV